MKAAYRLDDREVSRAAFYAAACDPRRHVCVEACAGAGKTWMLVARIVRALLDGAAPREILAITFTRKAAGEMRTRLATWLHEASTLTPEAAAAQLEGYGLPRDEAVRRAGELIGLHERVLDSGGQVEVRTLHAWFAQLLSAAPLELLAQMGLGPELALLEKRDDLMPALMLRLHARVRQDATLRAVHRDLSLRHGRQALASWYDAALERRSEIELADAHGALDGVAPPSDEPDVLRRLDEPAFRAELQALATALTQREKYAKDGLKAAAGVEGALRASGSRALFDALRKALLSDGRPRARLLDTPGFASVCDRLLRWQQVLAVQDAHDDHAGMTTLTRVLFSEYAALKRERGLVDMNDLERVALVLLSQHELAGWVQQRLDTRVRHLLVDEFQDTSPLQWHALASWLSGYAGAGGGSEAPRVFIVGDPKQSIYRFRGADPRVFRAAQDFVVQQLQGTQAACDHTRRCAPGVVAVVNRVFDTWEGAPGLAHWRTHTTEVARDTLSPSLLALPTVEREAAQDDRAGEAAGWRPSLTQPRAQARAAARESEGAEVGRAIARLVHLEGVAPDRILVLARKRVSLEPVADALAALQVPQVEPEALRLGELPEAQDLLAMLDVLASPTQSLSLARALKSPLFGASDDDLRYLWRRVRDDRLSWWAALARCADDTSASPALQRAAGLCARWAAVAAVLPPHDLLDRIVHESDLMARLAAAVPTAQRGRALDAVRALLAAALEVDGGRYATPYGFVRALRSRRIEVPASQQADAVRLMTIHGAKGLEADIVFLVDTHPVPTRDETMSMLIDWPVDAPHPKRVAFVASAARCPPALQALRDEENVEREREEANALYVALTRARHRLVISRTLLQGAGKRTWWSLLEPIAQPVEDSAPVQAGAGEREAWVPTLPSRATDGTSAAAPPTPAAALDDAAARLGHAVHRVLEWAAREGAPERASLARAAAAEFAVPDAGRALALASRILDSASCRVFFDPRQLAWAGNEVPVAGAAGEVRRIDRLVRRNDAEGAWWVLDYKLNTAPGDDPRLREQLAGYRAAVAALVPGEPVRAAFITGAGELVELPG